MELRFYNADNTTDQKMSTMERLSAAQAIQSNLRDHSSGLEYLSVLLRRANWRPKAPALSQRNFERKSSPPFASGTTASPWAASPVVQRKAAQGLALEN